MEVTSKELKKVAPVEGEIPQVVRQDLTKDMEARLKATKKELKKGFAKVVKQGIKEEEDKEWTLVKEKGKKVVPNKAIDLVNATLEEEIM